MKKYLNAAMVACVLGAGVAAGQTQPVTGPVATASAPAPVKMEVPGADEMKEAVALVKEAYQAETAAAKTLSQRAVVARRILEVGRAEKVAARKYAMLSKARELAVEAGDVEGGDEAVSRICEAFVVDEAKLRAETYMGLIKTVQPVDVKRLGMVVVAGVEAALAQDRFETVKAMIEVGMEVVQKTKDADTKAALVRSQQAMVAGQAALAEVKKSLAVLEKTPGDADANLAVGKYRCFVKGDWKGGLPMLALGSDAGLKALAAKELAGPATAEEQLQVADGWWDAGEKAGAKWKWGVREHAGATYKTLAPAAAGIVKQKVDGRLAELEAERVRQIEAGARPGKINLMALANVNRDAVKGTWGTNGEVIKSGVEEYERLELLYHPPEEYNMRIEFSQESTLREVNLVLAAKGKQFAWYMGAYRNMLCGFGMVNGGMVREAANAVTVSQVFEIGKRYEAVVKVRKDGLEGYINGKLICKLKTDYSDMSNYDNWGLRDKEAVGVGVGGAATIYKIEIIEISGSGKIVK